MDIVPQTEQSVADVMDFKPPAELTNEKQLKPREKTLTDVMDVKPPAESTNEKQYEQRETTVMDVLDVKPPAELTNEKQLEQRDTTITDVMDFKPPAESTNEKQTEQRETTFMDVLDVKPPAESTNEKQYEQKETTITDVLDVKPPAESTNEKQYEQRETTVMDVLDVKPPAESTNEKQTEQRETTNIDVLHVKPPAELNNGQKYEQKETIVTDVMEVETPAELNNGSQYGHLEISKSDALNSLSNRIIMNTIRQCEQTEEERKDKTMTGVMYIDPTRDDTFLYCEDCQKTYKEHCPVHGPLIVVQNMKVEENDPDRALHSLPTNLLVKESEIDRAGLGVFTDTEIPPGTTYGPYEGMYISDPELANASTYCWQIYKDGVPSHFIDGKDTSSSNWMRYVNCARSESEQNLVAFQYKGEIFYRSCKPIIPKTELLVWYGENCAQGLGIPTKNTEGTKGVNQQKAAYRKTAVPSIFSWTHQETLQEKEDRKEMILSKINRKRKWFEDVTNDQDRLDNEPEFTVQKFDFVVNDLDIGAYEEIENVTNDIATSEKLTQFVPAVDSTFQSETVEKAVPALVDSTIQSESVETAEAEIQTEKAALFSIHNLENDPTAVHFYTGLENYSKFMCVFNSLGPAAFHLNYIHGSAVSVSVVDQFFIALIKLRRHKPHFELSNFFGVAESEIDNIFTTWILFMEKQWRELNIWPSDELVKHFAPTSFKRNFPDTRMIFDVIECPVKKPKTPQAHQATFSTNRNRNTVKALVGITQGGLISYVSPSFGGSISDREIFERSTLTNVCSKNDSIMADKRFNIQDILALHDVHTNSPTNLKKTKSMANNALLRDRNISSERGHVQRIIGLAKKYKILVEPMNATETKLSSAIIFCCFMLCNFRNGIDPPQA